MIEADLVTAAAISKSWKQFFIGSRDDESATFFRDELTGTIFLPDFYVGDAEYKVKDHREALKSVVGNAEFERASDNNRRYNALTSLFRGKVTLDFGCGLGDFIRLVSGSGNDISGFDLDTRCTDNLLSQGFRAYNDIEALPANHFDSVFMFHVLEHVPNPIEVIRKLSHAIKDKGNLVIEVPHGKEFLLNNTDLTSYKRFSLWTQHVVLYTEKSLQSLLEHCGFSVIKFDYVQRYGLANHMKWLIEEKPGGHKDPKYKAFNQDVLNESYARSLIEMKQTDTIIVECRKNVS